MPTFRATILKVGPGYWVDVPAAVVDELGRAKQIPVTLRYAGEAHASTVTPGQAGRGRVALRAEVFRAAGFEPGDTVEVTLTPDHTPRTIVTPPDLQRALAFRLSAAARWEQAATSTRRVLIERLDEARSPETRARRIERMVEYLAEMKVRRPKPAKKNKAG
jgi:hypothetical protein